MAGNLTNQVRNIAGVTDGRGQGRFVTKITVDAAAKSGIEEHHQHNGGPAQFVRFGVTRVARRSGTEANSVDRRSGKAWRRLERSHRFSGTRWRQPDCPGSHIAEVTTAVANGDLSRKSPWMCAAKFRAEEHHQHWWEPAQFISPGK